LAVKAAHMWMVKTKVTGLRYPISAVECLYLDSVSYRYEFAGVYCGFARWIRRDAASGGDVDCQSSG